jgi:hypothetical protein
VDLHPFRLNNLGVGGVTTINNQTITNSAKNKYEPKTRRITLIAAFSALYIVGNTIPISAFIGGAGFITAGIILLPVIARLLKPKEAIVGAITIPLGLFVLQLSIIPIFGFYGFFIPASGIIFGSLGFYRSYLYPAGYVAFGALWYIIFANGTLLWLLPYFLIIIMTMMNQVRRFKVDDRLNVVLHSFNASMCELVTMSIGSISLLHLPRELWAIITPFMYLERAIAIIGASLILLALIRIKGILRLWCI